MSLREKEREGGGSKMNTLWRLKVRRQGTTKCVAEGQVGSQRQRQSAKNGQQKRTYHI